MTLNDVKNYLRIDYDEDDVDIFELIEVSQIYIDSCVGEGYKTNAKGVKLAELLQKKIINHLYENRSYENISSVIEERVKQDKIVITILDILSNMGSDIV